MPAAARNSHRIEQTSVPAAPSKAMASTSQSAPDASSFQTEDEQIAAMLRVGADQWEQEKQNMARYDWRTLFFLNIAVIDVAFLCTLNRKVEYTLTASKVLLQFSDKVLLEEANP